MDGVAVGMGSIQLYGLSHSKSIEYIGYFFLVTLSDRTLEYLQACGDCVTTVPYLMHPSIGFPWIGSFPAESGS